MMNASLYVDGRIFEVRAEWVRSHRGDNVPDRHDYFRLRLNGKDSDFTLYCSPHQLGCIEVAIRQALQDRDIVLCEERAKAIRSEQGLLPVERFTGSEGSDPLGQTR